MRNLMSIATVLMAACGAVSAQTYTVLHNFGSQPANAKNPYWPGTIAQSRGGAMFATATDSGSDWMGKAFKIGTGGGVQLLHSFTGQLYSGLTLGTDGQYYGTTASDGTSSKGTVFRMSPGGSVTVLHNFTGGADGAQPTAAPIESEAGDFYGTAGQGGSAGYGTVYRITRDGKFTLLHTFSGSDGEYPFVQLVQGTDHYFYGITGNGGKNGDGTIFRISKSGDFRVLFNFNRYTNGFLSYSALIQATDGNFYGVTSYGGPADVGVLFRMARSGAFTLLHAFAGGSEGGYPVGLIQATDGNLYFATGSGGHYDDGALYRATLAGDLTFLHSFSGADGASAVALMQHTNGMLYGDTAGGGSFGNGVFFSYDSHLPPFVRYLPTYGRVGAVVEILGEGFTHSSVVSFNGTPATAVSVVYPTYIRATVPDGATTGPITVTTGTGVLTSDRVFVIHP